MDRAVRLLIIDDTDDDAVLWTRLVQKEGFNVTAYRVANAEAMRAAIDVAEWDVVFCDMHLSAFSSMTAVDILTERAPELPLIVLASTVAEDPLADEIRARAYDVLRKENPNHVGAIIERVLQDKKTQDKNDAVMKLLDESETRFRTLVETLVDSIFVYDKDGYILFVNESTRHLMRAGNNDELLGQHFSSSIDPDFKAGVAANFDRVIKTGVPDHATEYVRIALDGTRVPVEGSATRIQWSGKPAVLVVLRDASARYEVLANAKQSEARTTVILENVADGVVIIDENGMIKTFNRSAESMFGYSCVEVVGRSIECLIPDDLTHHHHSFTAQYMSSGDGGIIGQGTRELPGRRKDGTIFPTETTISEALVDGERILIGSLRDITSRKAADKALRDSEERFRWAFETAPHGMALVMPNGKWFQVNRSLCHLLGYSREEMLEFDYQSITHPDDLDASRDLACRLLNGESTSYELEKRFLRKDGVIVWVRMSVALMPDWDGSPLHFISQFIDLSALRHAEEAQVRLEIELRHAQKMDSLGTLSGGIAHEFNNMILPISGLIELSLDEIEDRPDVVDNLNRALENANRATALVDKILSFSRLDDCELVQENIASAIDDAIVLLRATIPSTINIIKELDDVGDASIDKTQISQIVMNLGVNAMQAIGTSVGRIEFKLKAKTITRRRITPGGPLLPGQYARLSVRDTGCGMDDKTVTRIFEPFFTTKEVGDGTGMGLAFVHGVIKSHGGVIDVKSQLGVGTTFDVFVPFKRETPSITHDVAAA